MHQATKIALSVALAGSALLSLPALAEWKPNRPVEFVVSAGPGGGTDQKPVGTVVFARAIRGQGEEEALAEERLLDGSSREAVRHQAALVALELLLP